MLICFLYLKESKKKKIHNKYIQTDIRSIDFEPNSFDAVIALDFIEHLTKEEGYKLIKNMEKWARKKIIIFTPNGYVHQNVYDVNLFQAHKSGWHVDEFQGLGFRIFGMNGWKKLRGRSIGRSGVRYKPAFLWELISELTQKVTYRHPNLAFQLFAIKEIKN